MRPKKLTQQKFTSKQGMTNELTVRISIKNFTAGKQLDITTFKTVWRSPVFKTNAEINIPLVNRDFFELNKFIDIPKRKQGIVFYTTTATKYLAVNVEKDMLIQKMTCKHCIRHTDQQMFCPLNQSIYSMTTGQSLRDSQLQRIMKANHITHPA